jgi:enolase
MIEALNAAEVLDSRGRPMVSATCRLSSGAAASAPVPSGASLVMVYDVYQATAALVERRYGMPLLTADEEGLAPPAESSEVVIQTAVEAVELAGYRQY